MIVVEVKLVAETIPIVGDNKEAIYTNKRIVG